MKRAKAWCPALRGGLLAGALAVTTAGAIAADALVVTQVTIPAGTVNDRRHEALEMPFVRAPAHGSAATPRTLARINERLFIGQLNALPPRAVNAALPAADRMDIRGVSDQSFKVVRNDPHVLTIVFDVEFCGAYCENSDVVYAFDVTDGATLTADNLFTTAGMKAIADRVRQAQLKRYRAQIAELQKAKPASAPKAARGKKRVVPSQDTLDEDDTDERIALNQGCIDDLRAGEPTMTAAAIRGDFERYTVELDTGAMNVRAARCSNHAMRALDDVGDVQIAFSYASASPWLTAYGRHVLLDGQAAAAPEPVYDQVLHGALVQGGRRVPVTMRLHREADDSIEGQYFYDRVGRSIGLSGHESAGALTLTESFDDEKQPSATITLHRTGAALDGRWVGADGKTFEVHLAP